ncbi:hypothetical protein HY003_01045 [Candidatus Saccharibacteria bacterium]|nr:hypothetical protein [Candidatus Saccharibacteria bacterium]MBI3337864.1 hypothetical protein [Candidatus Saccharibacteria bacterium]
MNERFDKYEFMRPASSRKATATALVLAGLTMPGVFFGWLNARNDDERLNQARLELATTQQTLYDPALFNEQVEL